MEILPDAKCQYFLTAYEIYRARKIHSFLLYLLLFSFFFFFLFYFLPHDGHLVQNASLHLTFLDCQVKSFIFLNNAERIMHAVLKPFSSSTEEKQKFQFCALRRQIRGLCT